MSESGMRQIEAMVRREKVPDVDKALRSLGVSGMTMTEARGRGRDEIITTSYVRGKWTFSTDFVHRVIISVVVDASDVDKVVDAIVKSASTKKVGDGKIFVHRIERAIDISTGEADDHTLNPGRATQKSTKKG
jgi:nitrogen regulatory protein PII